MTDNNNNNTEGSTIASAKWPQDAPHDSEEHVISVLCGEQQYRWAIHEGVNDDFFPILSWRTATISIEDLIKTSHETPCDMLNRYLPTKALDMIYGENQPRCAKQAICHRSGMRIPAISIYCIFGPGGGSSSNCSSACAQKGLQYMFKSIPSHIYKINAHDFFGGADLTTETTGPPTVEQLATVRATHSLFPQRPCFIVDGGDILTLTATTTTVNEVSEKTAPENAASHLTPPDTEGATSAAVVTLNKNKGETPDDRKKEDANSIKSKTTAVAGKDPQEAVSIEFFSDSSAGEEDAPPEPARVTEQKKTNGSATTKSADECAARPATMTTLNDVAATAKEAQSTEVTEESSNTEQTTTSALIQIVAQCHTMSINGKLHAMHEQTGALPEIDYKYVQQFLDEIVENPPMAIFATNTVDAMLACVLQETALFLRLAVKEWAFSDMAKSTNVLSSMPPPKPRTLFSVSDPSCIVVVNDVDSLPVLCITGMEADILTKLLDGSAVVSRDEKTSFTWLMSNVSDDGEEDSLYLRLQREGTNGSTEEVIIEVKKHRHLAFHGIRRLLAGNCLLRRNTMSPAEKIRQQIIGCRVAKVFPEGLYRGQVMSVDRGKTLSQMDLYLVRYDDGDIEEVEPPELYDLLLLFHEKSEEIVKSGQRNVVETKKKESSRAARLLADSSVEVQQELEARSRKKRAAKTPPPPQQQNQQPVVSTTSSISGRSSINNGKRAGHSAASAEEEKGNAVVHKTKKARTSPPRRASQQAAACLSVGIDSASFLNRRIAKEFTSGIFFGTIDRCSVTEGCWHVKYDDGDSEDIEEFELDQWFDLYAHHARDDPNPSY